MRSIIFAILAGLALPAFAAEIECVRPVSETRTDYALIETWPVMRAETGFQECTGQGGFQFCYTRSLDSIADYDHVCGYGVQSQFECRTSQGRDARGNYILQTQCPRWNVSATLQVRPNGRGQILCRRGNQITRVWQVGYCRSI